MGCWTTMDIGVVVVSVAVIWACRYVAAWSWLAMEREMRAAEAERKNRRESGTP